VFIFHYIIFDQYIVFEHFYNIMGDKFQFIAI